MEFEEADAQDPLEVYNCADSLSTEVHGDVYNDISEPYFEISPGEAYSDVQDETGYADVQDDTGYVDAQDDTVDDYEAKDELSWYDSDQE